MWLDLNGSPSLNYIHFTCHLVFKNRNHCSLGEQKTEPASVYDMPQKGQTHLHQEYATQILERWLKQAPAALSCTLTGAACSGSGIHFKLDKQGTAFENQKRKKRQGARQSWISAYLCFPSGHYLQLYLQSDGGCASPGSGSKKKATSNRQRRRLLFTNGPPHAEHIGRTKSEGVPRETGHWMRLWKYWIHLLHNTVTFFFPLHG